MRLNVPKTLPCLAPNFDRQYRIVVEKYKSVRRIRHGNLDRVRHKALPQRIIQTLCRAKKIIILIAISLLPDRFYVGGRW
jgi:hypothetical protein